MSSNRKYWFLFEELVKRDFKKKYKRTVLGMLWSVLYPLLYVLVLNTIFTHVFGRTQPHFIIYVFCGILVMTYFTEATNGGMRALMTNASIFSKINVPKYIFVLSKDAQSLINLGLSAIVFFVFCFVDGIKFGPHMFMLIIPVISMTIMQFGIGMILASLFVFFRDIEYLYSVFLTLLTYASAIFYPIDIIPADYQQLLIINPVYVYIKYFRIITIDGVVPDATLHVLCFYYALFYLLIGCFLFRRYDKEFIYYI